MRYLGKVYASKVEFSIQKTLLLVRKGFTIQQIAEMRSIKEGTVWNHFANLIEYGQLSVWSVMPKRKIVRIISKIKNSQEQLKQIKERISEKDVSYDEIDCVRAHLKMKEKISKNSMIV